MKTYSVKIEIKLKTNNDEEAKRLTELFIKEQPRMDDLSIDKVSIYNSTDRRIVTENL